MHPPCVRVVRHNPWYSRGQFMTAEVFVGKLVFPQRKSHDDRENIQPPAALPIEHPTFALSIKIASDWNKPNGQWCVGGDRAEVLRFLHDLPVRKVIHSARNLSLRFVAHGFGKRMCVHICVSATCTYKQAWSRGCSPVAAFISAVRRGKFSNKAESQRRT